MLAQNWSGVLDPSRAINWSQTAGLPAVYPDGETTPNGWTPPTRVACTTAQAGTTVPIPSTITVAALNTALSNCAAANPTGSYLLLGTGTFAATGCINMPSNITLRGQGASKTILSGPGYCTGTSGGWAGASLLSSVSKNATSITATGTPPSAGRIVALAQCMSGFSAPNANFTDFSGSAWVAVCTGTVSDPSGPWVCGGFSQCDRNGNRGESSAGGNPHYLAQLIWVPSVVGSTINLASPVESPLWSTGNTLSVMWANNNGTVGAGLEDVTYTNGFLTIQGCYGCWVKGVRNIYADTQPLVTRWVTHTLFANNYFVATGGTTQWTFGGENDTMITDTDTLVINNIMANSYAEEDGGQTGMVWAYNFDAGINFAGTSFAGEFQHNPGGQEFFLREGNQATILQDDSTWTTHNFDTWFRNWATGFDPISGVGNPNPIDIGSYTRFDNAVGNVIGFSTPGSYAGMLGVNRDGLDTTGLTTASTMRWGNFVLCTGDTHCQVAGGSFDTAEVPSNLSAFGANSTPFQNPVPANHNLPASFFLTTGTTRSTTMPARPSGGTGLSWWKVCDTWTNFSTLTCGHFTVDPMPAIGPDVTGGPNMSGMAYNIPAVIAFNSMALDPTFGGTVRQFDEAVYTLDPATAGPAFSYTPVPVSFGNVSVNSTSGPTTVTITNTGTSASTLILGTLGSPSDSEYAVSSDTCSGHTLTVGGTASCTFAVSFTPTSLGPKNATISVPDNVGNPDTISLAGTGADLQCPNATAVGNYKLCGSSYINNVSSGTSVTGNYSPIAGNGIIIWSTWCFSSNCASSVAGVTATISDNMGDTFFASPHSPYLTNANGGAQGAGDFQGHYVWYLPAVSSGVTSFTVSFFSGGNPFTATVPQINISEWRQGGLATLCSPISSCFETVDQSVPPPTQAGSPGANASIPTSGATANPSDLIFSAIQIPCCTFTGSAGTGYTGITIDNPQNMGTVVEAKGVTATGTQAATASWTGGSPSTNGFWFGVIAPIKGASQGNPPASAPMFSQNYDLSSPTLP